MPKEPVFSVWFKGKELRGTRAELRQLINDVEEALSSATELCVKPPKVDRGTLSCGSVRDFFRQAYPDKTLLGVHATQLFNNLLNASKAGSGPIVFCGVCKKRPTVKHCDDKKLHSDYPERLLIDVESLKRFAPPIFEERTHLRGFGPMQRRDLKTLFEKL